LFFKDIVGLTNKIFLADTNYFKSVNFLSVMYKKYLVVVSRSDLAGMNISRQLFQFKESPFFATMKDTEGFDIYYCDDDVLYNEFLDMERINKYDFIIFASKHSSEKHTKTLSIHAPGNWREAKFGGEPGKISRTSALFQKELFETLSRNAGEEPLLFDFEITMECTHHGPLLDKPCVFIEIGSTIEEWNNRTASFVVAKTISDCIKSFKFNKYREIAFGIGGPHYCPDFNRIQLKSNVAISHVIPRYSLPLTEEMIKEALEKTEEEIDFAVLSWKGLGDANERQKVIDLLEKNYIQWKKVSDIR
jgi:D-tyrosyl-tRNA(Tyr) deacylase